MLTARILAGSEGVIPLPSGPARSLLLFDAMRSVCPSFGHGPSLPRALALAALALAWTAPVKAAVYGVPTNLNAAGQVCTAVGTPAGCVAVSADPPGWFVLERLDSGSQNGDVVHQIRFFVEVTGTTLDIHVFDPGLGSPTSAASGARDLGNVVTYQYRLLSPSGAVKGVLTIGADTAGTENTLVRFACQDASTTALFNAVNAGASATNRIWGAGGAATNCAPLAQGLYIFEATATTTAVTEGRNAFGVEFVDSAGNPYNAYTIGNADDTIATVAATDTSMITGGVAGDKPTANVSGYTAFFPYVNRGCSIDASNFDLDADSAEGNGSVATILDTLGTSTSLARSNNNNVATTTVTVESATIANPISNNYGMYTLTTQLDEWATAQNHVDWRIFDFQGSTAGAPANLPRHAVGAPMRMYLPNNYSACSATGCTLVAPQEPVLAGSAVLVSGENPPLPAGAATRFAITATVANPGTTPITNVQITIPAVTANGITFVAQTSTIDGTAAACTDASVAGSYRRCTFATLAAGSYASLIIDEDYQPPATGLQNLTGAPAAGAPPPNTTIWAQYTPASQSATFTRTETLGPICQLSVNAATSTDLRLRAPTSGITDAPDPVTAGNNLTYTYRLDTPGAAGVATNPSVSMVLPTGTTFVSASVTGGSSTWTCVTPPVGLGGTLRCSAADQDTTDTIFTIVVKVASTVPNGTILSTTPTAQSANVEATPADNSLTITTTVVSPTAQADVSITKTGKPSPVAAGRDIAYTLTVSNAGPATALNVVLADTVPAGTTFRSIGSAQAWSCTTPPVGGTGAISCSLASLAAGTNSVLILRVRVNAAGIPPPSISNTATVTNTVTDPVAGNNSSGAIVTTVAAANTCPTAGKDGAGGTLAGTIDTYYPGTGSAAAGSVTLTLGASRGATTPIAIGDLLLIIQMQDAAINTTNTDAYGDGTAGDGEARGATAQNSTGRYEYAVAASAVPLAGGTLTVTQGLFNSYTTAAATAGMGQRRYQVIRVPQYTTATLGPTLAPSYWDGSSGGVLVFDVQGALALGSTTVDVSGRGFRGGGARQLGGGAGGTGTDFVNLATRAFHGSKGEGTAGTPRYVYDPVGLAVVDLGAESYPTGSGSFARGAPGNAGGGGTDSNPTANDQNSGGGGGGNGGLGGRGGNAWNSNAPVGGFGGAGIAVDAGLMTLGGGGGAGSRNNSTGDESSGNSGGGIVMIRADSLTGTGTITADGLSANTADTTPDNDGGGGGGAGGSVLVYAPNGGFAGLTVNARGGRGSDAWPTVAATAYPGERHGPGGGGGGGRVFLSAVPAAAVVTAGQSGITSTTNETYGASDGSVGTVTTGITTADIPGVDTTGACSSLAVSSVDLGITVTGPNNPLDPCSSAAYVFAVTNAGPDAAIDATASFPVPANTSFQSLASPAGWTCTTPAFGATTGTASCTNPLFASGGSVSFTMTVEVSCTAAAGTVLSITGSVSTTSTDTYAPNNTTAMSNVLGSPLFVLSRASLRGLRVRSDGLVEFATGWQQGTLGFNVYETNDPAGRLGLQRLNADMVPAPRPDSQTPMLYSVRTGPITGLYLVIEELERSGRRNRLGPFPVGDERLERLLERVERRLERAGAQDTALSASMRVRGLRRSWRDERARYLESGLRRVERRGPVIPTSLKIETAGRGTATVPRSELLGLGLPSDVALSRCRLTNAGRNVAFRVEGRGQAQEALVFDAEALQTPYTSRNVYVLTWARNAPAMAVPLTLEGDPVRRGFERVDRPAIYVASVPPGTDPWLWDQLVPGYGAWPYDWDPDAGRFELPGWPAVSGPTPVRLRFQGMTDNRHKVAVTLNGESLGEATFEGVSTGYLEAVSSTLRPSGNELRIEYSADNDDPSAYAYLDYFEAARPAGFVAQPVATTVLPFDDDVPANGADYLIVTHPDFAAQAARLAAGKRRQGLKVAVADVQNLYDRWSAGIPEANAVAEEIRRIAARGGLRFVLLFGDDSFDPDDRSGLGGRSFVPSLDGWDGVFGRVASENRYADVDGDGKPDLAIGRLPASTPEQADALVAKVEQQQVRLAAVRGRQLFAMDNTGKDGYDFGAEARLVASRLPSTSTAFADLNTGIEPARQQLFNGLAQGAAFTHYFGHGGPQTWADEGLLTVEDAASLPGSGTVVLTWTCLTEFYQYLFGPSVNEAMVLNPSAGALAAFGPAGITEVPLQGILYRRVYEELARGGTTLGEAIQRAKARAVADDPRVAPVVEGWNLLGDPALYIDKNK